MTASSILFIVDEELAVLLFAKYVRMSLKQGNSEAFLIALGSYAITLCFGLKSYKTALRLVEVVIRYSKKMNSVKLNGKLQFMVALILQYLRPQESGCFFQKAGQLSLEAGDMVYAGYAISSLLITESRDLRQLNHLCKKYADNATQSLDSMSLRVLYLTMQYVHLLENKPDTKSLTFNSERFSEDQLLREEMSNNTHKAHLYYYYTCKLEACYVYSRYSEAVSLAEASMELEPTIVLSFNQKHCLYHALSIMAVYPDASDTLRRGYRKVLAKLRNRMKRWTKVVPESTLSKYVLMKAELARLEHDHPKAAKLYEQAIEQTQEAGYPQDEAIANELAANYYLSLNKHKKAEAYLQNACKAYFNWGAEGKAKSLQERHPVLMELSFAEKDSPEGFQEVAEHERVAIDRGLKELDMDTLRQASILVSKNHAETESLERFLDLAIRNAGAERGYVMLGKAGELVVEAEKDINRMQAKSLDNGDEYSTSIVQFVMRTRESVVLGEARHSIFAADPYIRQYQPRSILCLPIRYPDHRVGVLYLENNLISDAFTAERLEILEMIFSRMAYLKLWQSEAPSDDAAQMEKVKTAPSLVESLSNREMDVLRLMAEGLSNKESKRLISSCMETFLSL